MDTEQVSAGTPSSNGAAPTVLVVEDTEALRVALCELLREQGYRVETAGDGAQAAQAARRSDPDVIIMDLRLPGEDGLSAIQEIRTFVPGALVIVHSFYSDPMTRKSLEDEGVFRYVVKGSSPDRLLDAVKQAIAQKRSAKRPSPR